MKFSKAEWAALAVAAGFLLFFGGWYFRGVSSAAGTYVISPEHPPVELTSPSPKESFLPETLLDLNTATLEDLEGLPGIGGARAQDILDYRTEHGSFARPEELMEVPGIGQSIYEGLKDYITVKEASGG